MLFRFFLLQMTLATLVGVVMGWVFRKQRIADDLFAVGMYMIGGVGVATGLGAILPCEVIRSRQFQLLAEQVPGVLLGQIAAWVWAMLVTIFVGTRKRR